MPTSGAAARGFPILPSAVTADARVYQRPEPRYSTSGPSTGSPIVASTRAA